MHLSFKISLRIFLLTLAPRAYVTYYQARRLSGHTSPRGEYACFLKDHTFQESKLGTLHQERNLFLIKSTMHSLNNLLLRYQCWSTVLWVGQNVVATLWATFMLIEDVKPYWSKKLKTACFITIHGAHGLAVGVKTPIPLRLDLGQEAWPITRTVRSLIQLLRVLRKEIGRGDQAGF